MEDGEGWRGGEGVLLVLAFFSDDDHPNTPLASLVVDFSIALG